MDVQHEMTDMRNSVSDQEFDDEERPSSVDRDCNMPRSHLEQDKRVRREIANSNERRRMQSINAGFQSLRTLIPQQDGEKMSKAGILQQSAEHITTLESEKTRLLSQNAQLKKMLRDVNNRGPTASSSDSDSSANGSPPPKRKKRDTESSDEGISMGYEDPGQDDLKRELIELRHQLDRERRMRMRLEEEHRALEARMYPERIRQILQQDAPPVRLSETPIEAKPKQPSVEEQSRVQQQQERCTEVLKPVEPPRPAGPVLCNSMSRRNLETIVEAIRHLEGDGVLMDHHSKPIEGATNQHIPHSEESVQSTACTEDDCKSHSSGRDSPLSAPINLSSRQHMVMTMSTSTAATAIVTAPGAVLPPREPQLLATADRYPIAMQLLHTGALQLPQQPIHRPAVIVQKSS